MANASAAPVDDDILEEDLEIRLYECTILYPYPLSQKEEKDAQSEVEKIFKDAGAKLVEKDVWGRRGLAYSIGGYDEGAFVVYYYEMDPSKLKEVNTVLHIAKGILRHLIVKPPKGYEITKFSQAYEEWMNTRETVQEVKDREKQEELQRKVVERAKRQAKRADEEKKEQAMSTPEKTSVKKEELTEKLEELISDDDLEL